MKIYKAKHKIKQYKTQRKTQTKTTINNGQLKKITRVWHSHTRVKD